MRTFVALVILFGWANGTRSATVSAIELVRVCDVLRNLEQYRGKTLAVVGRYSFRANGRYLSESACAPEGGGAAPPAQLPLRLDSKDAPRLPEPFDLDAAAADRQLKLVRQTTQLGKFRFGSLDYDRWAIVWGRVENVADHEGQPPRPHLVYRGDGLIFFFTGN